MILLAERISKSFGERRVLNNVDISCQAGEIRGVLGENGAGKTTLFKVLLGLVSKEKGKVIVNSNHKKPLGGIVEKPSLYEYLSAVENLRVFSRIQGLQLTDHETEVLLKRVGLPIERRDVVKNFSLGMKQRLGIAVALLNNPSCLILDEPFSGLDPMGITALRSLILKLAKEDGLAILLSSHIIEELSKVCDYLYVIKKGEVIKFGDTQKLINQCSKCYHFYGLDIELSNSLKPFSIYVETGHILAEIKQVEIPSILSKLYEEGIQITSCYPEIDMNQLFEV
ncbi:ABC transporter ATP-binding protein [Mangrovimonas aestuarii]|uniref:ABC transporter ATP-binding protein n=1 Tax=Mangrovimonas aestuarii TaxID=3018443 RepID=UPI0023789A2D|nr:ABC transporter ATP-binding protein [Mangrovimonas aestuarii]